MVLPSALHEEETLGFQPGCLLPHPGPFLGLAGVLPFLATKSPVHRSFPTGSLTLAIKKRTRSHPFLTCAQARRPHPARAKRT